MSKSTITSIKLCSLLLFLMVVSLPYIKGIPTRIRQQLSVPSHSSLLMHGGAFAPPYGEISNTIKRDHSHTIMGDNNNPPLYLHRMRKQWLHWLGITIPVIGIFYFAPIPPNYKLNLGMVLLGGLLFMRSMENIGKQAATNLALPQAATKLGFARSASILAIAAVISSIIVAFGSKNRDDTTNK